MTRNNSGDVISGYFQGILFLNTACILKFWYKNYHPVGEGRGTNCTLSQNILKKHIS